MPLPPPGPIEGPTARILAERETELSPWLRIVEQDVLFPWRERSDLWHIVAEPDGVVILPVLPDGRFAMIGQFRPALRAYSWEFPAGTIDASETPEQAAIRECREETGLTVRRLIRFGRFAPAPARLSAQAVAFAAETDIPAEPFQLEEGVKLALVTREDIHAGLVSGQFQTLAHIGLLYLWDLYQAGQWRGCAA